MAAKTYIYQDIIDAQTRVQAACDNGYDYSRCTFHPDVEALCTGIDSDLLALVIASSLSPYDGRVKAENKAWAAEVGRADYACMDGVHACLMDSLASQFRRWLDAHPAAETTETTETTETETTETETTETTETEATETYLEKRINGRRYSTRTAKRIAWQCSSFSTSPSDSIEEALYQKRTGEYFLAGEGGARTRYAATCEDGCPRAGEGIIPLSDAEARIWLHLHNGGSPYDDLPGISYYAWEDYRWAVGF